ncbi:hypothetical protein PG996_008484 [Apiospora saccharicola]|uniref:Secreted protein n=1 Tax=Apiospora saccharicola TaxID=335842 RepID=A0ABR1UYQ8_9PEZI
MLTCFYVVVIKAVAPCEAGARAAALGVEVSLAATILKAQSLTLSRAELGSSLTILGKGPGTCCPPWGDASTGATSLITLPQESSSSDPSCRTVS